MLSTIYHTFNSASEEMMRFLVTLDYAGVSLLIFGSAFPIIYYTFSCHEAVQIGNWMNTFMTGMCSLAFLLTILPCANSKGCHKFRMVVFLAAGLSTIFPLVLMGYYKPREDVMQIPLWLVIMGGAFYIVGVLLYGFHLPEKLAPGRFDIIGQSHQIFHVAVVLGSTSTIVANTLLFFDRQLLTCSV